MCCGLALLPADAVSHNLNESSVSSIIFIETSINNAFKVKVFRNVLVAAVRFRASSSTPQLVMACKEKLNLHYTNYSVVPRV